MKAVWRLSPLFWSVICLAGSLWNHRALSQGIIPEENATGTQININRSEINIEGGIISEDGANLFHSFQEFGLDANQIANFISNPEINNILGRVVGGNPSVIHGLIQVLGGNSNLYLINPAGFVLFPGSSINVPGDFTLTTATGVGIGDNWLNAFGVNDYQSLVGEPTSFAFDFPTSGTIINAGRLEVEAGNDLFLIGGSVFNTGTLTARGGNVAIVHVPGESLVRISQPGQLLSIEIDPPRDNQGQIVPFTPQDLPALLTGIEGSEATGLIVNEDGTVQSVVSGEVIPTDAGTYRNLGIINPDPLVYPPVETSSTSDDADSESENSDTPTGNGIETPDSDEDGSEDNEDTDSDSDDDVAQGNDEDNNTDDGNIGGELSDGEGGSDDGGNPDDNNNGVEDSDSDDDVAQGNDDDNNTDDGNIGGELSDGEGGSDDGGNPDDNNNGVEDSDSDDVAQGNDDDNNTDDGNIGGELNDGEGGSDDGGNPDDDNNGVNNPNAGDDVADGNQGDNNTDDGNIGGELNDGEEGSDDGGNPDDNNNGVEDSDSDDVAQGNDDDNNTDDGNIGGELNDGEGGSDDGGNPDDDNNGVNNPNAGDDVADGNQGDNNTDDGNIGGELNDGEGGSDDGGNPDDGNNGVNNPNVGDDVADGNQDGNNTDDGNIGGELDNGNNSLDNPNIGDELADGNQGDNPDNGNNGLDNPNVGDELAGGNQGDNPDNGNNGLDNPNIGDELAGGNQGDNPDNGNIINFPDTTNTPQQQDEPNNFVIEPNIPDTRNNEPNNLIIEPNTPDILITEDNSDELASIPESINPIDIIQPPSSPREVIQPIANSNTNTLETNSTLSSVERSFTNEFINYYKLDNPPSTVTIADARDSLSKIEDATGVKAALIYVFFVPTASPDMEPGNLKSDTGDASEGLKQASIGFANYSQSRLRSLPANSVNQDNLQLEILVVTAQGETKQVLVSNATQEKVLRVAQQMRQSVTDVRQKDAYLAPAQQLYQWLIEPIKAELESKEIDNLVFMMNRGLRSLPLAALHDGNQFLVEQYSLAIMPSLSLTSTDYRNIKDTTVLAMGAEEFTNQSPLPAVPTELSVITENLWQGSSAFLNEMFTRDNLKQTRAQILNQNLDSQPFGIIHLATHAQFRPGKPSNSYIQWWDGRLGLNELPNLNLGNPPVELMVLSACRTALGDHDAELGFAGLAVQAGVKSAMGSLWYVSDIGTLALMTKFYEQLKVAPIKADALRQAQLAMLRGDLSVDNGELITSNGNIPLPEELKEQGNADLSHPYYWSSFTMIGNPW